MKDEIAQLVGPVSHERARNAAQRLINTLFNQSPRATASIPPQPNDDDLVIAEYINQQEQLGQIVARLRGSIGFAYISDAAVFEFITAYDSLVSRKVT